MKIQDVITTTHFVLAITLSFVACPVLYKLGKLNRDASIGFLLSLIIITLIILIIFLGITVSEILREKPLKKKSPPEDRLGKLTTELWQEDIAGVLLLGEGFEIRHIIDFLSYMDMDSKIMSGQVIKDFLKKLCENGYAKSEMSTISSYTESGEPHMFKGVVILYFATEELIQGRKNYRNIVVKPQRHS